jgi:hypothetical protein
VNVSGVGATPPRPPLPPVAPPPAAVPTASGGWSRSGTSSHRAERDAEREAERPTAGPELSQAPPLRMITVTEMRVMLGQLPASAAIKQEQRHLPAS